MMPTKISTLGRMGPTYGPSMWQDEGSMSEFSSDDQYRQQNQRRDPDILDPYSRQEPYGKSSLLPLPMIIKKIVFAVVNICVGVLLYGEELEILAQSY